MIKKELKIITIAMGHFKKKAISIVGEKAPNKYMLSNLSSE
jgi:hypothetical protein